jgi:hypothetical protein
VELRANGGQDDVQDRGVEHDRQNTHAAHDPRNPAFRFVDPMRDGQRLLSVVIALLYEPIAC